MYTIEKMQFEVVHIYAHFNVAYVHTFPFPQEGVGIR